MQDLSGIRPSEDSVIKRFAGVLFVGLHLLSQGAYADDTIIVFDASGPMWGRIEGMTSIDIAHEFMAGLLVRPPADKRLGLMAYGHRRMGDCTDAGEVAYLGYANARDGSPARLQLPAEPGAYEFRYVLLGKKVIARRQIEVTAP